MTCLVTSVAALFDLLPNTQSSDLNILSERICSVGLRLTACCSQCALSQCDGSLIQVAALAHLCFLPPGELLDFFINGHSVSVSDISVHGGRF